ncbi:glycosyltransferase family 39 protein [Streptomyces actinomycinicus]|uniref:Glycosyltransferase family 39 protein n=1 Tax=Streptomyces actinomycinicus TaxID=1695166 RepID=A0A937EEL7_9ACTN|nr:glycosyltransferase family 39 protein [Streptomyces actinomycinicus]MBL1080734.1 glycosyltransferase family 39 protein [Streptomyces actinomycinicus]
MVITAQLPQPREGFRPGGPGSGRRRAMLWLCPFLLTFAVCGYGLTDALLGRDELVTWDVVGRDTGRILAMLRNVDAVHGTYYLLMHGWVAVFGDSVVSLRLPSLLSVAGAAAVVSLLGDRLFGYRAGILAGILLALVPAVSRYGQEARGYAVVMLAVALATLLLLRALDEPRSIRRWAAYALGLAFAGLLHLIALSVVLAHACLLAARARADRSLWWKSALVLVTAAVCVAPVAVLGRSQVRRQLYWVPEPGGWELVSLVRDAFASVLCAGVLITLALLARSPRRAPLVLCGTWALLPPVLVWAASHGEVSYFRDVYVLFTLPAWALLAGAGLAAACRSWKGAVALTVALGVLALPDQRQMRQPFEHDAPVPLDYAAAAGVVERLHRPGDAVVYDRADTWQLDGGVRYYLPRALRMRDVFRARTAAQIDDLYTPECAVPARCLRGERRIWLLTQGPGFPFGAIAPAQANALQAGYSVSMSRQVTGMTVSLLERRNGK